MGAADLGGLDDSVGLTLAQSQGSLVAVFPLAIDHGPLVESEAPEVRRTLCRRRQQRHNKTDAALVGLGERHRVDGYIVIHHRIPFPPGTLEPGRILQHDPGPRVPAAQQARTERVVGEEKVIDGMRLRGTGTLTPATR
jgi:hypothetical protein